MFICHLDYTDLWGEGSEQFSESVIRAYMCRYATVSRLGRTATNEDLARIHNGGPDGWRNSNTEGYWDKVSAQLSSGSCTGMVYILVAHAHSDILLVCVKWEVMGLSHSTPTNKNYTVEPPNKGLFGNGHFVIFSEAIPISEACHCLTI